MCRAGRGAAALERGLPRILKHVVACGGLFQDVWSIFSSSWWKGTWYFSASVLALGEDPCGISLDVGSTGAWHHLLVQAFTRVIQKMTDGRVARVSLQFSRVFGSTLLSGSLCSTGSFLFRLELGLQASKIVGPPPTVQSTKKDMDDATKIGIVTKNVDTWPPKEPVLLHSKRCGTRVQFRATVGAVVKAKAPNLLSSAPKHLGVTGRGKCCHCSTGCHLTED